MNHYPYSKHSYRVLAYFVKYDARHGYPPTIRETVTSLGIANRTALRALRYLAASGKLEHHPHQPRAYRLPKEET
jgi:hypothetical protein